MSFMMKIGNFTNQKNALVKETTWGFEETGELKAGSSIVNPVILIDGQLSSVHDYNYVYIPTWGRYYFITDIISVRTNLIELHLHCDVLNSFHDEIEPLCGIYERRENAWNLYINDGSIKVYQNRFVVNYQFHDTTTGVDFDNKNGSYILALAGS